MANVSGKIPLEVQCRLVKDRIDAGDDFLLLDCREQEEHDMVKIPHARLLPMSQIMARAAELEPFRHLPVIVHCHHGGRSLRVATWLRQNGYTQAQSMSGGIDQWAAEIDTTLKRY